MQKNGMLTLMLDSFIGNFLIFERQVLWERLFSGTCGISSLFFSLYLCELLYCVWVQSVWVAKHLLHISYCAFQQEFHTRTWRCQLSSLLDWICVLMFQR